jgi:hypothetical protein
VNPIVESPSIDANFRLAQKAEEQAAAVERTIQKTSDSRSRDR